MKLIALDMDGVVNSDIAYATYMKNAYKDHYDKLEGLSYDDREAAARKSAALQFKEEFKHDVAKKQTELVFPEYAARITRICNETNSMILWTSTWRRIAQYADIKDARDMFNRRGLPGDRLIAYSPDLKADELRVRTTRGEEITNWISNTSDYDVTKYAVIDDRYDAGSDILPNGKFFWINPYYGITDSDVEGVIEFLNS